MLEGNLFRQTLLRSVVSYFRLWDALASRVEVASGATPKQIDDEDDYWAKLTVGVHGPEALKSSRPDDIAALNRFSNLAPQLSPLRSGDLVRFQGWYLTDWAPRMPGELWMQEFEARLKSWRGEVEDFPNHNKLPPGVKSFVGAYQSKHSNGLAMAASVPVFDWFAKIRLCLAGVGSIRLPLNWAGDDHFAYLSAVTVKHWSVDLGVPIVVSRQVHREFERARTDGTSAVEADFTGRLIFGNNPLAMVPPALGANLLQPSVSRALQLAAGLPIAYVHVVSPIECSFRSHRGHPACNAWTLFRCDGAEQVTENYPDLAQMLSGLGAYGLTYCQFQPDDSREVDRSVRFLTDSPRWLQLTRKQSWNNWLGHGDTPADKDFSHLAKSWADLRVRILTDFDGVVPRLKQTQFNLQSNPLQQAGATEFIREIESS